jgi:hypothetical protein
VFVIRNTSVPGQDLRCGTVATRRVGGEERDDYCADGRGGWKVRPIVVGAAGSSAGGWIGVGGLSGGEVLWRT